MKPADLPVEEPIKYEFALKLKAATGLGIAVPDKLLALADHVIE
jgi:putative ABC transport system substrate-binding protein